MELKKIGKKGQISQIPALFKIMLFVAIFIGLTFIVLDKFVDTSYKTTSVSADNSTTGIINDTGVLLNTQRSCQVISVTIATNATDATWGTIESTNYTTSGCYIYYAGAPAESYNNTYWNVSYVYNYEADTTASKAINDTTLSLYDYGVGFIGILILIVMVYIIISIVSGKRKTIK